MSGKEEELQGKQNGQEEQQTTQPQDEFEQLYLSHCTQVETLLNQQILTFQSQIDQAQTEVQTDQSNALITNLQAQKAVAELHLQLHQANKKLFNVANRVEKVRLFDLIQDPSNPYFFNQKPQTTTKRPEIQDKIKITQRVGKVFCNPYYLIKRGQRHGNFITWPCPLSFFQKTRYILIRDSYEEIYSLIISKTGTPVTDHLVTGVPGIGTSYFCLYFIWRYINENPGAQVIFEKQHNSMVIFGPTESFVTDRGNCFGWDIPYLVDLHENRQPAANVGLFTVVFSSPNPERYKEMMKHYLQSARYVMPLWEWEEVTALYEFVKARNDPNDFLESIEDVSDIFDLVGGIPRSLFQRSLDEVMDDVTSALVMKGLEIVNHLFQPGLETINEKTSEALIHFHPDKIEGYCTRKRHYTLASDEIWKKLYNRYSQSMNTQFQNYFNTERVFGESIFGQYFENLCLFGLSIAGKILEITSLTSGEKRQLPIPNSESYNSVKDKNKVLQTNILYIPTKRNFGSGDAFFFTEDNQLFVLQITVGEDHSVKAQGLDEINALFPEIEIDETTGKRKRTSSTRVGHLVFVVPRNGRLTQAQTITTLKGKSEIGEMFEANQWRLEYE